MQLTREKYFRSGVFFIWKMSFIQCLVSCVPREISYAMWCNLSSLVATLRQKIVQICNLLLLKKKYFGLTHQYPQAAWSWGCHWSAVVYQHCLWTPVWRDLPSSPEYKKTQCDNLEAHLHYLSYVKWKKYQIRYINIIHIIST